MVIEKKKIKRDTVAKFKKAVEGGVLVQSLKVKPKTLSDFFSLRHKYGSFINMKHLK